MQKRTVEYVVILGGWATLFALPALYLYYESLGDDKPYNVHELWITWRSIFPYLVVFLLHHFLLFPLYSRRRFVVYVCSIVVLLGCFVCFQINYDPHRPKDDFRPHPEAFLPPDVDPNGRTGNWDQPDGRPLPPPDAPDWEVREKAPQSELNLSSSRKFESDVKRADHDGPSVSKMDRPGKDGGQHRPFFLKIHVVFRTVIAFLLMGVDLGVFMMLANRRAQRQLLFLEKEKLQMELSYLKYQVNPHFFMNTLNNIHALIDIDTELAKRTVIDLSHLLRYALYDSAAERVPLSREVEFIQLYMSLMRLRYAEGVKLEFNVSPQLPEVMVPPLLLICFVENAFKHGVSNRESSFVEMQLAPTAEGQYVQFTCLNSKLQHQQMDHHHGIGIANARKRLDLIYGDSYVLDIEDNDDKTFRVCLKLPRQI